MSTLSPHVYYTSTCLLYLHMPTLPPHVYSISTCLLYLHMSTLPTHVYSTSTCQLYLHMSTLHPHVNSTSICLPYLHMSILLLHIYSTSTCLLYIHMSTLSLDVYPRFTYLIQFRIHVVFKMKILLHLNPHSGCSTTEREIEFPCDESNFWCLHIFLLRHCVTWESECEWGSWKFIHSGETYESTCLFYLHMSTLPPYSPPYVYSTSTYLFTFEPSQQLLYGRAWELCSFWWIELLVFGYFSSPSLCYMRTSKRMRIMKIYSQWGNVRVHISTLPPHVYPTSTCLFYFYISILPLHVYSTSTCRPYLYMSTLALHI